MTRADLDRAKALVRNPYACCEMADLFPALLADVERLRRNLAIQVHHINQDDAKEWKQEVASRFGFSSWAEVEKEARG